MNFETKPEGYGSRDLWKYDVRIAKELGYSQNVIDMLDAEPNPTKRQHILHDARLDKIR